MDLNCLQFVFYQKCICVTLWIYLEVIYRRRLCKSGNVGPAAAATAVEDYPSPWCRRHIYGRSSFRLPFYGDGRSVLTTTSSAVKNTMTLSPTQIFFSNIISIKHFNYFLSSSVFMAFLWKKARRRRRIHSRRRLCFRQGRGQQSPFLSLLYCAEEGKTCES